MPEDERVAAFIDRVVAGARIPSRAARDDLRRELWTHFEEAGTSADAVREAMRRFGAEAMITESLRRLPPGRSPPVPRQDCRLAHRVSRRRAAD